MRPTLKTAVKISAFIFTNLLNIVIFLAVITPLFQLARSGYIENAGKIEFIKVLIGGIGIAGVTIACLTVCILSTEYYWQGGDFRLFLLRFTIFTAAEFLAIPAVILCYKATFSYETLLLEWAIGLFSLIIAITLFFVYFSYRGRLPLK